MQLNLLLCQPFPYSMSLPSKLGMAGFFGLFILGFLAIFKPFELDEYSTMQLLLIAFVYGLITFTCVAISTIGIPRLFPHYFNEASWTTGRQIFFTASIIVFVGLVNYLVSPAIVDTRFTFRDAIWFQGITLAVGVIPVSIFILIRQNILLRQFRTQAEELEKKLAEKQRARITEPLPASDTSEPLSFVSDYQNEKVEVLPRDLCLVASANNYIKVYYHKNGKLIYSIIRSTLKKAEDATRGNSLFFKCHRAFIINLEKVVHVEGNAQGYKLKLEGYDEPVPVSRNLNAEFSDKLLAYRAQSAS